MATVGHTLVGLSLGTVWKARLPGKVLPAIWIGFVVLCAHLIDLVEWVLVLIRPTYFTTHTLTNSPLLVGIVFLCIALLMRLVWRVRTLTPYLIVAAALVSHLIMDHYGVRRWLANFYSGSVHDDLPPLRETIVAEIWFYGFTVVLVLLGRAAMERTTPRGSRYAAIGLAIFSLIAMLTRLPALWISFYALATIHALLLLRREFRPAMLWGLVPLVPLLILVGVEYWATRVKEQALIWQERGEYAKALRLHRRALAAPMRSSHTAISIHMSICQRELGDWSGSERTLRLAIATAETPAWPKVMLASLLSHPRSRDTDFHRPEEARKLLLEILDDPASVRYHAWAQRDLDRLDK